MSNGILFILEDNSELPFWIMERAKKANLEVYLARWIDKGIDLTKSIQIKMQNYSKDKRKPIIALVDIMLPRNKQEWLKLNEKLEEREKITLEYIGNEGYVDDLSNEKLLHVRAKLDTIDKQIRGYVDMDGGLKFLESPDIQIKGWKIKVFSARTMEAYQKRIKSAVEKKGATYSGWFQKPLSPEKLDNFLRTLK